MLLLKNASLVDVVNAELIPGASVLIENGIIKALGADAEGVCADSVIDLKGRFLMPALVDMHSHFSGSSGFDHLDPGERVNTYDYTEAREGFLRWSVLTVRSCGDPTPDILDFRDDSAAGKLVAPRIYAAGKWIQGVEAHPAFTVYGAHPVVLEKAAICVDENSDLEAAVDSIKTAGSDWLKLFYASSPALFGEKPLRCMSRECLAKLTEIAHRKGMKVMVHIDGASGAEAAVEAGVDSIEHVLAVHCEDYGYSDELIEFIAAKGITIVPTMVLSKNFGGGAGAAVSTYEKIVSVVARMHKAGVRICAGCDSGVPFVPFGESLHDELGCLTEAGFSPWEALRAASCLSAEVLGCTVAGSIEPGKSADMLVLDGNPIEDISNTKKIAMVICRGRIVRDDLTGI